MFENALVKLDDIIIPKKRMRVTNNIEELAASIHESGGLINPLTLRRDDKGRLILIAGRRRMAALTLLKIGQAPCRILNIGETEALLIEIDENLQRAELTALEYAEHIVERKKVWEAIHPETKHGGTPAKKEGKGGRGKLRGKVSKVPDSGTFDNDLSDDSKPSPAFVKSTVATTGKKKSTIYNSAQIGNDTCKKARDLLRGTPLENKKTDLLAIAKLLPADQVAVAEVIKEGKDKDGKGEDKKGSWQFTTYYRARRAMAAAKIRAEVPPLPTGPFRVIVADPPWSYQKRNGDATKRENIDYATMTMDEIKALDVASLACEEAVLWLWTTNAHLPEAFALARAWGFTYKTLLTWDKARPGMGDWLRGQTEHCLFCARGKAAIENLTTQTTIIREQRTDHSVKPEAFYTLVESLCPGSKLELFARRKRKGWRCWGGDLARDEGDDEKEVET